MFSIRIVTTDHYQGSPIPGLDVQYADFRASAVKKVPVIRVYGSTPKGQKTCMHVHGVFPYLYVLYDGTQPWDRYLRLFANSLDKAINVAQGHAASEIQHVYKITLVSGIPMYGYHEREQQFLKIYFYNPSIIRRAADLLLGGAVLNKGFQPYESHIPYTLQMFIDYNLYGMNMLNVAAAKFRRRAQDENANPEHRKENRPSDLSSPTSPDGSLQDWLSNSSFSQSQPIWNQETITSDMYLGRDIVRQSTCELEVDVVAADILNRLEVDANVGNNPGLAALWADERQRKRNLGQSSQITPPASQERGHVEISDSDQTLSDRFREIVLHQLPYIDSQPDSMSESSQEDIFPSQTASSVDLHQSQPEDDLEASQSTIILDDEEEGRAAIVNMDSIHRVVSMSQSFAATPLSQQSDEPPDRSLALLLASLADDSSLPASQAAAGEVNILEEKDSILLEKPVVPDDETAQRDDAETLEMSQVVWEEGSQDKTEELESKGEELNFDLEGLDTTWNDSQAVDVSDDDEDLKIPQFDGANDEKPIPAKKSKKKRLGTTGPVISGFDKTSPPEQTPQSTPHGPGYNPTPQNMYGHDGNQYSNRDQFPYQGQGYGMGYGEFNFSDQWNPQGPYNDSPVQGYSMQGWDQQSNWSMMNSPNENSQQLVQGGQGLNSPQGHPQHQGNLQHGGQGLNSPQGHPQHGGQGLNSPQGHPQHGGQGLNSPQGHPQHQGHLQHGGQGLNSPQGHPQHGGQGLNSPQGHLQHASHRNLQSPHSMQGSPVLQTSHGGVQSPHGIQSPHDLPSPHGLEPGRSQGSLQTPQGIQHGNSQRNLQSPHGLQQGHSQGSLQMPHGSQQGSSHGNLQSPHGSQQGSSHGNLQSPHGSQHGNSRGSLQSTSKNSQGNLQSPHVLQGHSQGNLQLPYGLPQGNSLGSVQSSSRNLQSAHRGVDSSCSSGGNTASPVLGNQTMGQGAGFQAAVMEPRDSFSALMNDETLSNNLWNFSEFGGISDSDHTLTQGTDVGGQMGSTDQMYFPQSQPNFLSQASQELNSSQGQLSQFSPNQHGMTSTPVGASQNSQGNFNGNLQGVISNSQQTFSEQTGQSGSQVFPNSQIGNSQGNYQGFSDYSQQSGFPQQTFPNAFSSSYSTYQSQTSPKNNAVQSSSGSHFENSASRTSHSSEFETSPESVPPNFSAQSDFITPVKNGTGVPASANRLVNNQSRVSGEINVYNQSQYHMSGGNVTYSGAPKGGHQNTNTSSHPSSMVSSQFSNSHPNYQTGSFSRSLSEPQGGDGPGSSFSPHSYPRSQSGNQYYDSQKHFVNPNWSEPGTPNSKNSSQSKTPKRRGPKKKSEDDPTNSVSKKKSSKKSTKKSVPVSPVVTSAPPTVTLGSVLHGSASFQPRGYVTGGGNLLEKLLLANEERDKNESSEQGSQTSVTSSQNSSDTNNLNTAENNSMGPPSVTSRTLPDQSNNLGVLPNENIFDSSPKALPPNSVQQQTSNSDLRHYLSPFREKTPDSDKWPQQSAASNSQGSSLFSLQNLVSNVSQKTQFGHDVRQIATDGRPYTCSEGELRSFFQRNIGPLESMDSEAEPGNSTACEMPIRKPTNVSELIRNKVAQESRKKRSMSVTELPQRERTFSNSSSNGYSPFSNSSSNGYPPVSGMCSPSRGRAMSSSISSNHHSTPTSNQDRTISFNSSGVPPSNAELLVRERSMSISSTSGQLFVPNSDMMSRDGTFHSMDGYSAVGAEFLARERTMSTSSTSSNRTEFTKSLKQKSVNRPSLVRSFSTPANQKNGAPVRKRGRPPKIRPPPVSVQPSKYTYSFTVPTPAYKKIQFLQLKHHVPKEGVKVVHMHPMDARRYSLLKIGREVVKLKKLSEKELEKVKSVEVTSQRKVLKKPLQRRNTVPFVDRKNVYPSYEELRAEVAKSKGGTKLVAEEEKTFSELWCIDDKTSGPQPIEKITLASIIDKAFSAMSADDEGYGQMTTGCDEDDDELKACEDLCPKITSPNEQASDDACTQVVRENQPKQMVRSTKYQDQFFKYLQQATDMPIPVDEKYRKNGHGQTQIKASASKVTRKKKLLKLHKKLPLVIDPDQGELPDPVLKDVSLTEASDGTRTPVQSRTPITGRSPIRNQSTGELYRLFDSDVLDPRIKSSSSDTENSASEGGNTDSQKDSEKEEDSGEDSCSSEVSQAKDETTSKADVIDMTESQSSSNSQCEAENCENTEGQHCSDQTSHNTSESQPNSPCKNTSDTPSVLPHEKVENMEYSSSKSNESCHKLDQSDISEKRQTESSKTVLNLSDVENSLTVQNNYKECVQSPSQESATETGPPSNTGSDLENMLPASDNKRVPEPGETKKACQFEVHMTRSRSSSESSSRRQTNDEKLKTKSSGGSDLEKKRKSVRISRVEKKRKRETQGADYFVMEKFKGCKRMAVQLKRLNISNGTVVKLSQVFSLNTLFQKNGLNRHKTVQVPEMVAHEPFCDNIFEKFRSFHDSKFFGNIVSDDSSKDSTYFQPRKSRLSLSKRSLSLSKRSRPDDNVIEISSSEEEEEAQSKTSGLDLQPVIKNKWGMNKSVICIDKDGDTDDGEMEDGKESCDENSSGRAAKPTPKLVKKKKKLNKSGKIHMAFNGASYRARKRRARSFSGKLMSSLSVLHQATLANLVDNSPSYGELSDDYRTRYDDALYTMSLYSPPALEELEKSPPRAFSPTDLAEVDISQEKRNVFDDLYKAMMSDEEGRSPVYSPIKMAGPLFVSLNESPVKHVSSLSFGEESNPLNTGTKDFDGGLEKDGFSEDSVVNFRQGPDNVEEKPRGDFVNTDRGMFRPSSQTHNLQGSLGEHRSESVQSEKANTSFVFSVTDKIHNSTGSKIGPLHFKRKAVVKLQPLTEREIKRYCLQTACAGKENVPMVRGRDSASPPDLGPPIIPKFGKNSKEESASPPNLVKSDIFIHSEESVSHDSLNGNEKVFREGENSFSKRTCVQGLKHLVFDHNLLTMKGTNGNSLPKSGTDKTPDVESQTNTNDGANKNQERGDVNQAREALSGKRWPSKQGGDKKCFRSLSPTKKRVLKPQQAPPSRLRVEESAHQYGLHTVINKDAYCSKADDVPDKPREVGGRILTLQSNRVSTLMECLTTVNCEGLSALRQILVTTDRILPSQTDNQNLMDSITKDQALRCAMLGDRLVTMVPCKLPPSQASVRLWLKKKELYRQQKIQEKSRKQQQKDLQEINTPTEFTKIVTLTPVQQKVKDINMCDIQTPQHRPIAKEVSFNETAEIFNDESVSPVIQTGESSKEEITPHHSEKLLTSQDSDENMISPSPPQETVCSFRKDEDDIISPSPPKLTMRSVRRDSHQAGKTPTSRMRLDQLSSATLSKKQSCDAVRRTLIGSAHSTPVSMCSQTSLLGDVNVTPIQDVLDKDETTSKGAEGSGVFLTPRRVPLPGKQSLGKGDSRRSLMSSGEMKEMATPANSKGNVSQIDGPTPKNSFGFKVSQHNLQDAKAMHEVQNLTLMSLELHAETRRDLMPDPEIDPILAVFYNILNDVATDDKKCDISGVILVDRKSKECQGAMKNRKKSNQPSSPQPSTSHDTGSKVTSSPQPSTSYQNPPSPQASTSRDPGPSLKGKRPRSRSPSPRPGAKVQRANDPPEIEATLLQKSGVDDDLEVTYVENEQELFQEVLKLFSKWDPDILIGFEIQKLSWGYLLQRASHLSVNLCAQMSRIPDEKKKSSFKAESDEWGADHSSEIHIAGRVILNLWRILRHEVTLNIYTFENVTHHVVHQRVPHFSFQTLNSWLRHRTHLYRWRFIKYYLTRVQGNLKIVDQLDLIGRTSEFARVFGIEFYHVLSRGSQYRVESMMLRLAKPMNFIPSSPSVQQRARMRAPECIALTLEPESRFYSDPVVVLDFQSLYPSIMIAHNYCFSTCVGRLDFLENAHEGPIEFGCTHLRISPKTLNRIKNDVTVSPNGVVFVKEHVRKGIISKMVEEILNTRIMVKKSMKEHKDDKGLYRLLDARQLGLKLIANVTYGYTGANFSGRMPCIEVGDSIVRKARETLERALKLVEDRPDWGARVVYGDTDSMFIEMKGRSKEEAFRIGHEICDAVTAMNPKPIKLKFEKVYYPCVLQTKKRYVGYSYETVDQKEPVFDAKGIETVRRDSCPAVSKILERSIKILFGCKDVSKVKEYLLRQCRKFMEGKVTMQDCVFAKEYRGMKSYKPGSCVPALEIAKKLLRQDRRAEPRTGERVPYVIIYGSPGLPLIQLVRQPHELLADPSLRLNATYYITKQILPPLDRLFSLLGVDVFSWYNDMPKVVRIVPNTLLAPDQRKGTISQYFSATNCPVCDQQTNQAICNICIKDPQNVCVSLCDRIRRWEKVYHDLVQVCNTCMGASDDNQPCVSLDCPIMFRRVLAKQDVQKGTQLREVINKVLDF